MNSSNLTLSGFEKRIAEVSLCMYNTPKGVRERMGLACICEGVRVTLRRVQQGDAPKLAQWKNDPLVREMAVGWDAEITLENQEKDILESLDSPQEMYAMIIIRDNRRPIGYVRVNWLDSTGKFVWLRYVLGEERGKGFAKDALSAMIDWLFTAKGVHRIDAEVYEYNEASINLLHSLRFKHEGTKRQAHFEKGKYNDVRVYGLLSGDEPLCRKFDTARQGGGV